MTTMVRDRNGYPMQEVFKPGPHQSVTVSGTTARTGGNFSGETRAIRLCSSTNCYVKLGDATVEATTGDIYLPAGSPLFLGVPSGATRVAAIQASAGGVLSVLECA